eukprot:g8499.t1
MGNRASSPPRASERSSRGGSNATPTGRQQQQREQQQRNGERAGSRNITVTRETEDEIEPPADGRSQQQEMSWYQMAKAGYQELVNAIIRPPRAQYEVEALGPVEFEFVGKAFKRIDFRLLNDRGHVLECSHWHPKGWRHADQLPCIVYMHGNSSARVEALPQLSLALTLGATLVAFDFAGSGKSGGEHVSLGYYEREDLKAVIEHLRKSGQVSSIALWGRSMGAATALLHGDRDPSIAALVLDSAFADLTQLAEEMVERGRQAGLTVPGIVVKMVMRMIRGTVAKTANFNVRDLCPIKHADRTFIPALFVAGKSDDFIQPHHSKQICDAYAGDKNFITVDGDHNSPRPGFLFDSVYIFLQRALRVPPEWSLDRENTVMGFPPWHYPGGGSRAAAAAAAMFGAAAAAVGAARDGGESGGLDPDFADFDWDGVGLDDIGVDGNPSVGMTRARQAEFQTALFHMLAQERNEQTPARAGGGGRGGRRSPTAASPRARRREPRKTTPSSSRRGKGVISGGATGLASSDGAGAVELRNGELIGGGNPRPTEEQLLVEEEERGAEAVAAVAAAVRAVGTTTQQPQRSPTAVANSSSTLSPLPASMGFATPSAGTRPAMAPFSVSDTSDFEEAMSPGEGPPRRRGGSRGSETGVWASQASVAEEQEEGDGEEEGGVEGVAEVAAAAAVFALGVGKNGQGETDEADAIPHPAGDAGGGQDATERGAGAISPLCRRSDGEGSDTFFDAEGMSDTLLLNGGVVGAGEEEAHDEYDEDSLSGDGVGWKRAVGFVAPNSSDGSGADAGREWSCSKCTLRNSMATGVCLACASPREGLTTYV